MFNPLLLKFPFQVLLTKQSECEALHSEKSSLVLKLESMEHTIQIQEVKHKNSSTSYSGHAFNHSNQGNQLKTLSQKHLRISVLSI